MQKHPKGVKKGEAKSETAIYVCMLFLYMRLRVVIWYQVEVKASFKHPSLHAAIENHVQTNTNHIAT